MQSGLQLCIGRFKARLNLKLKRYTKCMDFTGDFYAACSGLFVHDGSASRSWL